MTAVRLRDLEPGSPEWLPYLSASKIAAVVGLSPWESPYSMWFRMRGQLGDTDTDTTRRGHYLEPGVAAWFADQHPDWTIEPGGTWGNTDRPNYQTASPDRIAVLPDGTRRVVEIKTASSDDGWGTEGTDEIPMYYKAQIMWQLDTLGLERAHVAVLGAFLRFREYVVTYDEDDAKFLRGAGQKFIDSLAANEPPDIDSSTATYEAVRQLHPDIDDVDTEIDPDLAVDYLDALATEKDAAAASRYFKARMLDGMGRARRATVDKHVIATRQPNGQHLPKLVPARGILKGNNA